MRQQAAIINAVLRILRARGWQGKVVAGLSLLALLYFGGQSGFRSGAPTAAQKGEVIAGEVVAVSDGDTVTVLDAGKREYKVRLAYIDAPEKSQPFGAEAKRHLSDLVYRQAVQVEVTDVDRYGRAVGLIRQGESEINYRQVVAGYAWHYEKYARGKQTAHYFNEYQLAEQSARERHSGLWHDRSPTAPWDFRRQAKLAGE